MAKKEFQFDFGFSAVSEEELEKLTQQAVEEGVKTVEQKMRGDLEHAEKTVAYYQDKLVTLEKMIIPFLNNLAADPEKAYIYWPHRTQKLMTFKEALLDELHN